MLGGTRQAKRAAPPGGAKTGSPDLFGTIPGELQAKRRAPPGGAKTGPLVVVWLALVPVPGWAQVSADCRPNPHLARAQDQYDRLEFSPAFATLQRALEHARNCRAELSEIYRLQAFINAVNARKQRCQRSFETLLALNPSFQLPAGTPPKISSCFRAARQVPVSKRILSMNHQVPPDAKPNNPLPVEVVMNDPLSLSDTVQVWFRRQGVSVYTAVSARASTSLTVVIPALAIPSATEDYAIEYFVRAVDRWEGSLAELGSTALPLTVQVKADRRDQPIYEAWWFWTLIGAAAAGAAATAVVLGNQDGESDSVRVNLIDGGSGP